MLEIFALPYFVVSGVIAWAVFSPFFRTTDVDSLSCASVNISDLLAISLPVSIVFLSASWMMPGSIQAFTAQASVLAIAFVFAAIVLITSLYLVPKRFQVTSLKRMTIVGIITPFGLLLTIFWIGLLAWVCVYSILYLFPSMIAIAAATVGLRILGQWVCETDATK